MMNDLELLREMFKDNRLHIGIGTVSQMGLAKDGSLLRVMINLLPENREVVAVMCFADVYDVTFPEIDDLVIVAFVDGHPDEAHVIKLVNSKEEKIPAFAQSGHKVAYARPGKKFYLGSDTKVEIGRPDVEAAQALVLGNVLVTGLEAFVDALLNATQIGTSAMGPVYLDPGVRTALESFKSTYLTTAGTNILSQISFTERGV